MNLKMTKIILKELWSNLTLIEISLFLKNKL